MEMQGEAEHEAEHEAEQARTRDSLGEAELSREAM